MESAKGSTALRDTTRPQRGRRRKWLASVACLLLGGGLMFALPSLRDAIRLTEVAPALLADVLSGIGRTAQAAIEEVFQQIDGDTETKRQLGEPLTFPPSEEVAWSPGDVASANESVLRFTVAGPQGKADVVAVLAAGEGRFAVETISLTPLAGGPAIQVLDAR